MNNIVTDMEKKVIIGLSGAGNSGKTSTLCILKELLMTDDASEVDMTYIKHHDFKIIIQYKGKDIAIYTWGDDMEHIKECIAFLSETNWEIAIVAMRKYGRTVEELKAFIEGIRAIFKCITKERVKVEDKVGIKINEANLSCARELLQLINDCINYWNE